MSVNRELLDQAFDRMKEDLIKAFMTPKPKITATPAFKVGDRVIHTSTMESDPGVIQEIRDSTARVKWEKDTEQWSLFEYLRLQEPARMCSEVDETAHPGCCCSEIGAERDALQAKLDEAEAEIERQKVAHAKAQGAEEERERCIEIVAFEDLPYIALDREKGLVMIGTASARAALSEGV